MATWGAVKEWAWNYKFDKSVHSNHRWLAPFSWATWEAGRVEERFLMIPGFLLLTEMVIHAVKRETVFSPTSSLHMPIKIARRVQIGSSSRSLSPHHLLVLPTMNDWPAVAQCRSCSAFWSSLSRLSPPRPCSKRPPCGRHHMPSSASDGWVSHDLFSHAVLGSPLWPHT